MSDVIAGAVATLPPETAPSAIPPRASRRAEAVGLVLSAAVLAVVLALPTPAGLPPAAQRLAALFAALLVLWVTEALPVAITSLLAVGLQPVLRINPLPTAISNFMNFVFFFLFVMFVIALAWTSTGLSRRFSLWMISRAGTDSRRIVFTFMLGTALVSTIMSDITAAGMFMAVALGMFERLRLQPGRSQFGKAVMIGIPLASYIGGIATPAGSAINILGLSLIERGGGPRIPFLHWMAIGVPMALILLPLAAWVLVKWFPPEIDTIGDVNEIRGELRRLGPITTGEWKLIVIMSGMILFWVLNTWFPAFDITLVGIAGATLMFAPGVKLFTWQEVQRGTGWDSMLLAGGVISLGVASTTTGLARWLVDSSLGGMDGSSALLVVTAIGALTVVAHLVVPVNPALVAVAVPPIMILATRAGHNPVLFALPVVLTASCAFLLPLDPVPLVTYGKGYYRMTDMLVPGFVLSVAWVVVMTVLFMIIGPMLGWT